MADWKQHKKEYVAYCNMRSRILQNSPSAKKKWGNTRYAKLDIEPSWVEASGFDDFLAEVGPAPNKESYLDRENNELGYIKGNVRWVSPKESASNRNNRSKSYTINGETRALTEWSKYLGIAVSTLSVRLRSGKFTPEEAITLPKNGRYKWAE